MVHREELLLNWCGASNVKHLSDCANAEINLAGRQIDNCKVFLLCQDPAVFYYDTILRVQGLQRDTLS